MVFGIGFPYTLPTTGNVSFQDLPMSSQHTLHNFQTHLSNATAFRGRLRAALKEHKHSANKDYINIQKAVEDYIPYLLGLLAAVESGTIKSGDIDTTWRCTLSNTLLSSKQPRVRNKSIYYEAVFTFLILGYVLMDRAREHTMRAQTVLLRATGDPSVSSSSATDTFDSFLGLSISTGVGAGTTSGVAALSGGSGGNSSSSGGGSGGAGAGSGGGASGASGASGGGGGASVGSDGDSSSKKTKLAGSSLVGDWIDHVRDEDMAQIDTALTMAGDLYCRAAGLFSYIVEDLIPRWNQSSQPKSGSSGTGATASGGGSGGGSNGGGASSSLSLGNIGGVPVLTASSDHDVRFGGATTIAHESSRPMDVQTAIVASHIRIALGEAHGCMIQKASLHAARARAFGRSSAAIGGGAGGGGSNGGASPGVAATGSKTSLSLLAKLSIGVKEEYERAYGLIKAVKDLNEISTDFRNHAKDGKLYYEAMAQSFLGVDASESGQYGKAVAFLTTAQGTLASLAKSSKSPAIVYAAHVELHPVKDKAQSCQKINDSVTFEPLTPKADLLRLMPSGRDVLKMKKYTPPAPAFGASTTYQAHDESVQKGAYALQGAYF